jgi:hypothetical protein
MTTSHAPRKLNDLPRDPEGKIPNPFVSKSGTLLYWTAIYDTTHDLWLSMIGGSGVLSGRDRWKCVGISLDQKSAITKAKGITIFRLT